MNRERVVEVGMLLVLGFVAALFVMGFAALALEVAANPACVIEVCA